MTTTLPTSQEINSFLSSIRTCDSPIHLETLTPDSIKALYEIGSKPGIWTFSRYKKESHESFKKYFDKVLARKDSVNFAIREAKSDKVIGFTRLKAIDLSKSRSEIGTWIIQEYQGKGFNYFIKKELLSVAFLLLKLDRIYSLINIDNVPSIKSLTRLGFKNEKNKNKDGMTESGKSIKLVYYYYDSAQFSDDYLT